MIKKQWNLGLGTIFSLIVVYFIYLYSKKSGWQVLAFISKWYLFIVGGFTALSIAILLVVLLFSLVMFLMAIFRLKTFRKKSQKKTAYVDVEYEVKE